jgi:DNA-binding transcriptional ArsR family regulator
VRPADTAGRAFRTIHDERSATSEDEPADAFALLADETRVAILRALAESWNEAGFGAAYGLSFSELRERVGVRDSSRFNYHLQRLTGRFARKTDEGYVFGYADRGFDVDAEPYWHVDPIVDDDCESVISRDPWRFEVAFPYGGDRLTVTLDGDGTAVGIDRPG